MASNTFQMRCSDGLIHTFRRGKQGRHGLPAEMRARTICITLSPEALTAIDRRAKEEGLSRSAYLELAGVLYR